MKHFRPIIILLAAFLSANYCHSQILEPMDKNPLDFRLRVKQVEEFMRRFNLEEKNELFESELDYTKRMRYNLTALFDYEILEARKGDVVEFVETVLQDSVKLHFTDSTWNAIAECSAIYENQETEVTLTLGVEHVSDYMYKWVIQDAKGKILRLPVQKENPGLKISPTDNEVNFMSLNHITTSESKNIRQYGAKGNSIDELSSFCALVYAGKLRINHVKDLSYVFHIHDYEFVVRHFMRDALNSGWLISEFRKTNK